MADIIVVGAGGSGYVNSNYLLSGKTFNGITEFESPLEGINETGHSENGYARITKQD